MVCKAVAERLGAGWCRAVFLWAVLAFCTAMGAFLPASAYADEIPVSDDPFAGALEVDWDDGAYLVDVELSGGTGKATVDSPAKLQIVDGLGSVTLVWSSPNYDYMLVDGKKYLSTAAAGQNSTFEVPVTAYDEPMAVVGDTTAMSEPHEVDYTLTLHSESLQPYDEAKSAEAGAQGATAVAEEGQTDASSEDGAVEQDELEAEESEAVDESPSNETADGFSITWPWMVFIVCALLSALALGVTAGIVRGYGNQ